MPDFRFEDAHPAPVAGIDEAGRGPWAGPVVAAAVILDRARLPAHLQAGIDDSKKLTRRQRDAVAALLPDCAVIGIGRAEVDEIDRLNILQATLLAMRRAVAALAVPPATALVDGNRTPVLPCPARAVIGGDAACLSIAAASIAAKVNRDRIMAELAAVYPGYGWEDNAGYGTRAHRAALDRLGPSPQHRRSFRPIANMLIKTAATPQD